MEYLQLKKNKKTIGTIPSEEETNKKLGIYCQGSSDILLVSTRPCALTNNQS